MMDVAEWFDDIKALLDGNVAANLANRIMQHEDATIAKGEVHGLRYIDGQLMIRTDGGWVTVGAAQTGYTAHFFDYIGYSALTFDLKQYTAFEFDSAIRTSPHNIAVSGINVKPEEMGLEY
jgi:hypothetical protein